MRRNLSQRIKKSSPPPIPSGVDRGREEVADFDSAPTPGGNLQVLMNHFKTNLKINACEFHICERSQWFHRENRRESRGPRQRGRRFLITNHQRWDKGRPRRSKVKSIQRNLFRDAEKWLEKEARGGDKAAWKRAEQSF